MKKRNLVTAILLLVLVLCVAVGLTACKLNLGKPQDVNYDGAKITWEAVEFADHYSVSINNGASRDVYGTSIAFDSQGNDFTVTIIAMPSGSGKVVKANTTTKDFVVFPYVSRVNVRDDGTLTWATVERATGYIVKINDVEQTPVTSASYDKLPVGEALRVAVRPILIEGDYGYYSFYGEEKEMRILETPQNLDYDNSKVTWDSVANAYGYSVTINSEAKNTTAGTSLTYNANNRDFDCSVKAVGNHITTYDSAPTEFKKFIYLDTPTNLDVSDGIISWDAVEKATSYDVKLVYNGSTKVVNVETNSITDLPAGVNMVVSVCPICKGANFFSNYSATKTVEFLQSPILMWDNGAMPDDDNDVNVYWNSIVRAVGYKARITTPDGSVIEEALGNVPFMKYGFLDAGTYYVAVQSTINGVNGVYSSQYSRAIEVIRLAAPNLVAQNAITSNPNQFLDGFTVTYESLSNCKGYTLYFRSAESQGITVTGNQISVSGSDIPVLGLATEVRNVDTHIKALGIGSATIDGRIIVSLDSRSTCDFYITVGATPTGPKKDTNKPEMQGFNLTWNTVATSGYGYAITSGGNDIRTATVAGSYDMSYLTAGDFEVSVCSKGNGGSILASEFTDPISVHRLGAVTNVSVSTEVNNGTLHFDTYGLEVDAYVTFKVQFGSDSSEIFEYATLGNINDKISTSGTTVIVRAESNHYGTDGVYYMSSRPSDNKKVFYRLEAPTVEKFVAFATQKAFTWNAPANVNLAEYTPTYQIYNGSVYSNKNVSGTTLDLSGISAGYYTFQVMAIGDGQKYVNSELSYFDNGVITKLETPVVERKNGKYVWKQVSNDVASYTVTIDGKSTTVSKTTVNKDNEIEFTPTFEKIGNSTVYVVANGTAQGAGTISSDPWGYQNNQVVYKLNAPTFTVTYQQAGKLVFNITPNAANGSYAIGYGVSINSISKGELTHESGNTYSMVFATPGTYNIKVKALGVGFDAAGNAYVSSDFTATAQSVTVGN